MTLVLTVKNSNGPYTAKLKRLTCETPDGPHSEAPLGELAPGAEMEVSIWKETYLVVEEKELA